MTRLLCQLVVPFVAWMMGFSTPVRGSDTVPAPADGWYQEGRLLYAGIPVQLRFIPADPQLATQAWRILEDIDPVFNDWCDDSEIGRINAGGPGSVTVSGDLAEAFTIARRIGQITDGAFDVSVGPLRRLWREAERSDRLPADQAIGDALAAMGPDAWTVEGRILHLRRPGMRFDFGGLVKGMAVDRALWLLRSGGATAALVQVGGETGCFGVSPRHPTHVLGIPDPRDPEREWCRIRDPGTGLSGSTSGNYRNPITIAGTDYYHIFDPRTGRPIPVDTASVSVVFPRTGGNGLADGLTKLGAVAGADQLFAVATRLGGEAMVLLRHVDGSLHERHTAGWPALLVPEEEPAAELSPELSPELPPATPAAASVPKPGTGQ